MTPQTPPTVRPSLDELLVLRGEPHEFLRRLTAQHGHVVRCAAGPLSFLSLTHPDAVQHVLVTRQRHYSKDTFQYRLLAEVTGGGLLTTDGDPWLDRRRLLQPSFHRDHVAGFAPVFASFAERMVARWREPAGRGETLDIAAEMMHVALQAVVKTLFGAEIGERDDRLVRATLTVLDHIMFRSRTLGLVPRWLPLRANRDARAALRVLNDAILGTIDRRRSVSNGGERHDSDLLARLMQADVHGRAPLSDREMRDEMITMLIAGHETVASALTWTWYLLARHPEIDQTLTDEIRGVCGEEPLTAATVPRLPYAAAVFREAMRLYPPAWVITRRALDDDVVGEYRVPRGALIVLSPYVTQRHPDFWAEPERFDPERFLTRSHARPRYAYFPFGAGPHLCIGNHFAMVEAVLVIAAVTRRYRLTIGGEPPHMIAGVTLHPRDGLRLRAEVKR